MVEIELMFIEGPTIQTNNDYARYFLFNEFHNMIQMQKRENIPLTFFKDLLFCGWFDQLVENALEIQPITMPAGWCWLGLVEKRLRLQLA